jgi:hypothetical protein
LANGWVYNFETNEWQADNDVGARWYAIAPFDFGYDFDVILENEVGATIRKLAKNKKRKR